MTELEQLKTRSDTGSAINPFQGASEDLMMRLNRVGLSNGLTLDDAMESLRNARRVSDFGSLYCGASA